MVKKNVGLGMNVKDQKELEKRASRLDMNLQEFIRYLINKGLFCRNDDYRIEE